MPGYNNPDDYLEELDPITLGMDPEENRVPVRGGFSSTAIGSKDPLDATGYTSALDRVQQATAARPKRPEPKWWQRLAAGAAGFAGGYINADPRNRPVDMSGVAGEILAPGYRRKMGEWKEGVETAKSDADLEGKKLTAQEAIERIQNDRVTREARLKAEQAREALYQRQLNAKPDAKAVGQFGYYDREGVWHEAPKEAREYKPGYGYDMNGKVEVPIPTPEKPGPRPMAVSPGSTVIDPETGERIFTAPDRPSHGDRPASPSNFRVIESEKARNLRAAERNAKKRIQDQNLGSPMVGNDPATQAAERQRQEELRVIYDDLETEKDEIQNSYEAQIVAAGGSIAPAAKAPNTPKPAPGTNASLPPEAAKQLKPGKVTTFGNGQKWTIGADGKPKQV